MSDFRLFEQKKGGTKPPLFISISFFQTMPLRISFTAPATFSNNSELLMSVLYSSTSFWSATNCS